jgi:NADH:ubiquinone oxidoreductase subunit 6 (subunit J)
MRNMRSPLPIFIFIALGLIAVIGVIILGASSTAAVAEVNNTSTEELPLTIYHTEYYVVFGIAAILILLAGYFAFRTFL